MAKYHTLLSGEKINLDRLTKDERTHIRSLERRIGECKNHDREDYFNVAREGNILLLGRMYTARTLEELYNSDHYKIADDLTQRYWYRCFSKEKNFEKHIKKHGMEEEYSRYLEQSDSVLMALDSVAAKVGLYPIRVGVQDSRQNKKPKRKKRTAASSKVGVKMYKHLHDAFVELFPAACSGWDKRQNKKPKK